MKKSIFVRLAALCAILSTGASAAGEVRVTYGTETWSPSTENLLSGRMFSRPHPTVSAVANQQGDAASCIQSSAENYKDVEGGPGYQVNQTIYYYLYTNTCSYSVYPAFNANNTWSTGISAIGAGKKVYLGVIYDNTMTGQEPSAVAFCRKNVSSSGTCG